MKMPAAIDASFFAPCGMNCMVCYKHCYAKKPCAGCLPGDEGKPAHCRKCRIKECIQAKGHAYCFACADFPCKFIKSLEKSYNQRYHASLLQNSLAVQAEGMAAFMRRQRDTYTCPACGGVVSLHDAACSECGRKTDGAGREAHKPAEDNKP